ncbi:MAG: hypothetical protein ACJA08_002091 [Cyclobacteriaceae bacterium]|jgi:hypothetical protein
MKYAILLLSSLFLFSCEDSDVLSDEQAPSIKYGTSFGFCVGYCLTDIEVSSDRLYYVSYGNNNSVAPKTINMDYTKEKYLKILNLVDQEKFLALDPVIGCPDCADGGAEWIEMTIGKRTKKVTFEYGKEVEGVEDLILKLRKIASELK